MPYEPPPNDAESKKYYERSEKALRNMRHDSSRMHQTSVETSTPQKRPYNNNDGCRDKVLQFLFLAISFVSLFS